MTNATREALEIAMARQEIDKNIVRRMLKLSKAPSSQQKRIAKADISNAVCDALNAVAQDIRWKAKQTPAWAMAYASALVAIEEKINEVRNEQ